MVLPFSRLSLNKIPCTSENTEAKTLPANICVFWLLLMAFTYCCCPLIWLPIWLQSECFIHCHIFMQKSFLLHWNSSKECSESLRHCCFWWTVSKHGTHFEHSFLIDYCSCKMVNTLPSDIFNSSAISCNLNLRSVKTRLWSFLVFSGTTTEFRWPEHSASFVFKVSIPPLKVKLATISLPF